MPNINLRLTDQEHAELRAWAHGARRSMQREIVFRLFDGAVLTERGGEVATVPDGGNIQNCTRESSTLSSGPPRSVSAAELVRSVAPQSATGGMVSVAPAGQTVPVVPRAHMKGNRPTLECPTRVPAGETCPDCGRVV